MHDDSPWALSGHERLHTFRIREVPSVVWAGEELSYALAAMANAHGRMPLEADSAKEMEFEEVFARRILMADYFFEAYQAYSRAARARHMQRFLGAQHFLGTHFQDLWALELIDLDDDQIRFSPSLLDVLAAVRYDVGDIDHPLLAADTCIVPVFDFETIVGLTLQVEEGAISVPPFEFIPYNSLKDHVYTIEIEDDEALLSSRHYRPAVLVIDREVGPEKTPTSLRDGPTFMMLTRLELQLFRLIEQEPDPGVPRQTQVRRALIYREWRQSHFDDLAAEGLAWLDEGIPHYDARILDALAEFRAPLHKGGIDFSLPDFDAVMSEVDTLPERGSDAEVDLIERKAVGRNDPCPCGSGQKFKKCCHRLSPAESQAPPRGDHGLVGRGVDEFMFTNGGKPNDHW